MYRIIERTRSRGRPGLFKVEFSRPWPENVERIYLIGDMAGLYPGFKWLEHRGDRGYTVLELWPGEYVYGFMIDGDFDNLFDPENDDRKCFNINFHPDHTMCLSRAYIPYPENPLENIYHFENDPSFLYIFRENLIIRFKADNRIDDVLLDLDGEILGASSRYCFDKYCVYEYRVKTDHLKYRFIVVYRGERIVYGYNGVNDEEYYTINTDKIPRCKETKWYMGTIYYQVFIDSFENGDPANDPPNLVECHSRRVYGYCGGDLRGLINRLNHLEDLGVEAIYITPIYKSTSYHRYDVVDYYTVDPYLGSMSDFEELVDKTHRIGVKIILDMVMHHTSPCHRYFVDVVEKWRSSKYHDWFLYRYEPPRWMREALLKYISPRCRIREIFHREEWVKTHKPFYEGFFNSWTMAKFNHRNRNVLEYFIDVSRYWMGLGVNGFRIDVGMGIEEGFLEKYYRYIKSISRDFILIGEVSEHPRIYSHVYDSVMNYYLRRLLFDLLVYRRIGLREFVEKYNELYTSLPVYRVHMLYNMLGSHDTPRIKTVVRDKEKLKQLYALLFTLPGSPAIYYGDEIGLEGGHDPDNRRMMIWDKNRWDIEIYELIKRLIKTRKEWRALRIGYYEPLIIGESILVVKRFIDDEVVLGVFNIGDETVEVDIGDKASSYRDLLTGRRPSLSINNTLILDRYGFKLLGRRDGYPEC